MTHRHAWLEGASEESHVRRRLAREETHLAVDPMLLCKREAADRCLGLLLDTLLCWGKGEGSKVRVRGLGEGEGVGVGDGEGEGER